MFGVIIFVVVLALFTYGVRALAVRHFDKIYGTAEDISKNTLIGADSISDEIIAVITIAAYEIIKKPISVKSIHFIDKKEDTSWSRSGRLSLMSSHFVK